MGRGWFDSLLYLPKKERPPGGWSFFFGAGYGSRTRLHGLGSRCITDIRILHGLYYSKRHGKIQVFFVGGIMKEPDTSCGIWFFVLTLFQQFGISAAVLHASGDTA